MYANSIEILQLVEWKCIYMMVKLVILYFLIKFSKWNQKFIRWKYEKTRHFITVASQCSGKRVSSHHHLHKCKKRWHRLKYTYSFISNWFLFQLLWLTSWDSSIGRNIITVEFSIIPGEYYIYDEKMRFSEKIIPGGNEKYMNHMNCEPLSAQYK